MMIKVLHGAIDSRNLTEVDVTRTGSQKTRELQAELLVNTMRECCWIRKSEWLSEHGTVQNDDPCYPEPTPLQLKTWAASVKRQETKMIARQRNGGNVTEQIQAVGTETMSFLLPSTWSSASDDAYVPTTEVLQQGCEMTSVTELMHAIAEEFHLNEKQRMVLSGPLYPIALNVIWPLIWPD